MDRINWKKVKLVIFDVDGTLYSQTALRKKLLPRLSLHYLIRPWRLYELFILYVFRKEREHAHSYAYGNLEQQQYLWCASKTNYPVDKIKEVVNKWIYVEPIAYLEGCIYPGLKNFMSNLQEKGVKTAVYSDYPADKKIQHLGLNVSIALSSTDREVDHFKPHPKAIQLLIERFNVKPSECVFIGDRDDRDGQCARNAGIPYLILPLNKKGKATYYQRLTKKLLNESKR